MRVVTKNIFTANQHLEVRQLVRCLAEDEQAVITMRFWDSWALYEIAEFLAVSVSEVEQILNRALKQLRALCLMSEAFGCTQLKAA